MASGNKHLKLIRKKIGDLLNAERSPLCWELGYFQAPIFIQEPGETPTRPYMLVCIDAASQAIMGSDLLRDPPSPQNLLSLLVDSMGKPLVGGGLSILPESVRLDDAAVFALIRSELEQLDVKVELVKRLSVLAKFKKIVEREWFSRQVGYSGTKN